MVARAMSEAAQEYETQILDESAIQENYMDRMLNLELLTTVTCPGLPFKINSEVKFR